MQIGHRIRVGGSLGKAGKVLMPLSGGGLTKVGHAAGEVLDNKYAKMALAAGLAATGVGAPASALLMAGAGAGGKLMKKGGNIGQALKQGAVEGVSSYGVGKLAGGLSPLMRKIPGADAVSQLGAKASHVPGASAVGDIVKSQIGGSGEHQPMDEHLPPVVIGHNPDGSPIYNDGQGPSNSASDPGRYRSIGDFLSGHKNDILDYGAAAEGVYDTYRRNKMQDEALGLARGNYNANAPLRDAARAALLDNSRPDLSGVFNDLGNPNGRYRRVNVGSRA